MSYTRITRGYTQESRSLVSSSSSSSFEFPILVHGNVSCTRWWYELSRQTDIFFSLSNFTQHSVTFCYILSRLVLYCNNFFSPFRYCCWYRTKPNRIWIRHAGNDQMVKSTSQHRPWDFEGNYYYSTHSTVGGKIQTIRHKKKTPQVGNNYLLSTPEISVLCTYNLFVWNSYS